ncbi:MAG TPA: TolC family protein [Bacteroidales bacterium]|nr:TolC family protein [Bacteroidales bacterium]HRX97211.1 TolC family protein [Bacteroidales bacterium]
MKQLIQIKTMMTFVLVLLMAQPQAQDMLNQYLMEAAENNPGLRAKYNDYMAELEQIPQVGTLPDPKIGFGYFIQPVETRVGPQQAKFSVSQMFPWFGTLGAREDVITEKVKAKLEALEDARSILYYNVKAAFYNLYVTKRSIEITRENIEILNTFRDIALDKVETGKSSAVDVLRAEIEISDLENQLADLLDLKNSQQVAFNNLLNVESERSVLLPEELQATEETFEAVAMLDSIRQNNHSILKLQYLETAFAKQQDAAVKMGMPGFAVGVDYIMIGKSDGPVPEPFTSGRDAIVFPTVGVTIPLYRNKYKSMVQEAVYRQDAAVSQKEERFNMLETLLAKTGKEYRDADRRLPLYQLQTERARKAVNLLETEYATEGTNFEEILRMERQLLKYRLETEKARADKNAAIAFVNYLMGK